MNKSESDAFVFFGATGDLAYKKIFPALYAMVRRGGFHIPIIGMARAGWDLDKLKQRARDSVQHSGDFDEELFAKLAALLRYVDGDYADPETFAELRKTLGSAKAPSTIWRFRPACLRAWSKGCNNAAARKTRASSSRSRLAAI